MQLDALQQVEAGGNQGWKVESSASAWGWSSPSLGWAENSGEKHGNFGIQMAQKGPNLEFLKLWLSDNNGSCSTGGFPDLRLSPQKELRQGLRDWRCWRRWTFWCSWHTNYGRLASATGRTRFTRLQRRLQQLLTSATPPSSVRTCSPNELLSRCKNPKQCSGLIGLCAKVWVHKMIFNHQLCS